MELIWVLTWYLTVTIFGILVLPLGFRLFQFLPDRGISFIRPLGLLLVGFVFWFLASFNLLSNDNSGLILCGVIVVSVEIVILKKKGFLELKEWISGQSHIILASELLILLAFLGWTIVRAYNPDIEGTEKPMEYMFLNSILKSPSFPLRDAWLSDHAISYYYFGYLIIVLITRITATPPPIAFNLGLALIFALSVSGATGLLLNMIALVKKEEAVGFNKLQPPLIHSFWPALLGPLIVLLVGNFYGVLEFIHDNGLVKDTKIPAFYYDFGYASDLSHVHSLQDFERKPGLQIDFVNFWEWLDLRQLAPLIISNPSNSIQWSLPNWFYSARVVHDRNLIGQETEAIDETPAFSLLLGDLHPHVLALPFGIVATALAFEWLLAAKRKAALFLESPNKISMVSDWIKFGLTAVVLGALIILNTWDFPIYWFLIVVCWTVGVCSVVGIKSPRQLWRIIGKSALLLLGSSLVIYFPFFISFQSQAGGILPELIYPTRFQQILVMFAPVFIAVFLFLLFLLKRVRRMFSFRIMFWTAFSLLLVLIIISVTLSLMGLFNPKMSDIFIQSIYPLTLNEALSLLLQRRMLDSLTAISAVIMIGMTVSLIVGTVRFSLQDYPPNKSIIGNDFNGIASLWLCLIMTLVGALLLLGPEFVYLRDIFRTRMNTMFKFYFQVWILWGLAGGFGIWYLYSHLQGFIRFIFTALVSTILLVGLYFLYGGLISKFGDFGEPPTLDGMSYFAKAYPDDWAAIQWLNEHVKNDAVILEGSRGEYWMEGRSARFSMATGLPTVMGWAGHEEQWRGTYFERVKGRQEDIKTIYQLRDWQKTVDLLNKYQIHYVIFSSLERDWYKPVYSAKFDLHLNQVFKSGDVMIYER